MNVRVLTRLVALLVAGPFILAAQVTHNPQVEEASANYIKITKVEITDRHTAIYLRFTDNGVEETVPRQNMPQPRFYQPRKSSPEIWLDPNTRLYRPGDVNTKFRFLRVEGIPTNPERRQVESGEVVEFIAYFEKVTPGIEIIDFYEGKSSANTTAWNFYGVHINNPDPKKKPKEAPKKATEQKAAQPAIEDRASAGNKPAPSFAGLSGSVLNAGTGKPVPATISYEEAGDTIKITTGSGKFRIALEPGRKYVFKAFAEGFGDETWELDTSVDSSGTGFFAYDFRLSPLSEGTTFTLENIYFETSSYTLLSESFAELDRFVRILNDNPGMYIRVEGHTDNVGDFDKNVELSRSRAESVKAYLVEKGIGSDRIETRGYGPTKPLVKGSSEEQRQKNRRVEIVVLKS